MNDEYKITIKIEGPKGENWEALTWIGEHDWERIMKAVEKTNEDLKRKTSWDPAAEIAYGMIPEGLRAMKRAEKER